MGFDQTLCVHEDLALMQGETLKWYLYSEADPWIYVSR